MTDATTQARDLADWALANPEDAAKIVALLLRNPGGRREVYLPSLKSTMPTGLATPPSPKGQVDARICAGTSNHPRTSLGAILQLIQWIYWHIRRVTWRTRAIVNHCASVARLKGHRHD